MKYIKYLATGLLLLCATCLSAQTVRTYKEYKEKRENIEKNGDDYYIGTGLAQERSDANAMAMQDMMSHIVTYVFGNTTLDINQREKNGDLNSTVEMSSVVKTYTQGQLKNVKSISYMDKEKGWSVVCYMKRDDFQKIVDERRSHVMELLREAKNAEKDGKIDDALRKMSKSWLLLMSLPDPNAITYEDLMEGKKVLIDWIPDLMREILGNLKVDVGESDGEGTQLFVKYNDKPVTSVRVNFDNGMESAHVTAKNGMCTVEPGEGCDIYGAKLTFEYAFAKDIATTAELSEVAKIFKMPEYDEAKIKLPANSNKSKLIKATQKEIATAAQELTKPSDNFVATSHVKSYIDIVMKIDGAIRQKEYESVREHFTEEGYEMYDKLLHYGKAKILHTPKELHVYSYRPTEESETKYICRSIPMQFSYGRRKFVEDVTFTFNSDHKIECVAFGLDKPTREQIYTEEHLGQWGDEYCTMLATFLENYKTAWALHRLDYIESIFADDARIITGHVLKKVRASDDISKNKVALREGIKYTEMNKKEYMRNLEECFENNSFINLCLTDCLVERMGNPDLFGINIHQDYFSNTYSDSGFLCLLIDVKNPELPQIKFRTWQPQRDPSINNKVDPNSEDGRFWGVITGAQFNW